MDDASRAAEALRHLVTANRQVDQSLRRAPAPVLEARVGDLEETVRLLSKTVNDLAAIVVRLVDDRADLDHAGGTVDRPPVPG